ncbi:DUF4173 domain-containing protein [Aerococcaceae bacterium zg-ZUI334]|uniref:DUF4153 domain-containing protein n=1 Tax=Aerococcaceae bacterium zg-252 TaxID=2796928 RepID=UPI001BA39A14|nr:DUF4173 domain-containing protein [Aerococcaceae bacterium zg-ZUI334]
MNNEIIVEQKKSTLPLLDTQQIRAAKLNTLWIFIIAYLYTYTVWDLHTHYYLLLTLALIAFVEYFNHIMKRNIASVTAKLEYAVLLISCLIQSFLLSTQYDLYSAEDFLFFQVIALHFLFIGYVLVRSNQLIGEQFNWLSGIDVWRGSITIPFSHFFTATKVLLLPSNHENATYSLKDKIIQILKFIAIIFITTRLVAFAVEQLSVISSTFDQFAQQYFIHQIQSFFEKWFTSDFWSEMISMAFLSIPVSMWLYGLIAGAIFSTHSSITPERTKETLSRIRVFSALNITIIVTALCLLYSLFFIVSLQDLATQLSSIPTKQVIQAAQASHLAVSGFWQLVQITLLNFFVLGFAFLFGNRALWYTQYAKISFVILFSFNLLFSCLAAWKLIGIYIWFYGLTPLRLQSSWLISIIIVSTILTLIRLFKPITAFRYGILYFILSYTLLCVIYYCVF